MAAFWWLDDWVKASLKPTGLVGYSQYVVVSSYQPGVLRKDNW